MALDITYRQIAHVYENAQTVASRRALKLYTYAAALPQDNTQTEAVLKTAYLAWDAVAQAASQARAAADSADAYNALADTAGEPP